MQFSNFIGETLDYLVFSGFSEALLVGHAGKLVKIAAGVMNTHSSVADGRMAVSYTHLDVYKRQAQERLACAGVYGRGKTRGAQALR